MVLQQCVEEENRNQNLLEENGNEFVRRDIEEADFKDTQVVKANENTWNQDGATYGGILSALPSTTPHPSPPSP